MGDRERPPEKDPARFSDTPSIGPAVDDDGEIVDMPPGPKRDREEAIIKAWESYYAGDRRPLVALGFFNP